MLQRQYFPLSRSCEGFVCADACATRLCGRVGLCVYTHTHTHLHTLLEPRACSPCLFVSLAPRTTLTGDPGGAGCVCVLLAPLSPHSPGRKSRPVPPTCPRPRSFPARPARGALLIPSPDTCDGIRVPDPLPFRPSLPSSPLPIAVATARTTGGPAVRAGGRWAALAPRRGGGSPGGARGWERGGGDPRPPLPAQPSPLPGAPRSLPPVPPRSARPRWLVRSAAPVCGRGLNGCRVGRARRRSAEGTPAARVAVLRPARRGAVAWRLAGRQA